MPRNRAAPNVDRPALLVSFVYLKRFLKHQSSLSYRNWALDSGAFSAFNSGAPVDLAEFIATAKRLRAADPSLADIFALDVIGNLRESLRNYERMWKQGVEAIPCYHFGEPEWALTELAAQYPKIALGGCANVLVTTKIKWAEQCFARVWPKRIHGFGFGGDQFIRRLPFHSVDFTSWSTGPQKFGKWRAFGYEKLSSRGVSIRAELEWYLRLEREMQARWEKAMGEVGSTGPTVRLAVSSATQMGYFR